MTRSDLTISLSMIPLLVRVQIFVIFFSARELAIHNSCKPCFFNHVLLPWLVCFLKDKINHMTAQKSHWFYYDYAYNQGVNVCYSFSKRIRPFSVQKNNDLLATIFSFDQTVILNSKIAQSKQYFYYEPMDSYSLSIRYVFSVSQLHI